MLPEIQFFSTQNTGFTLFPSLIIFDSVEPWEYMSSKLRGFGNIFLTLKTKSWENGRIQSHEFRLLRF